MFIQLTLVKLSWRDGCIQVFKLHLCVLHTLPNTQRCKLWLHSGRLRLYGWRILKETSALWFCGAEAINFQTLSKCGILTQQNSQILIKTAINQDHLQLWGLWSCHTLLKLFFYNLYLFREVLLRGQHFLGTLWLQFDCFTYSKLTLFLPVTRIVPVLGSVLIFVYPSCLLQFSFSSCVICLNGPLYLMYLQF